MNLSGSNEQLIALSQNVIATLQALLPEKGITAKLHFELEGCYIPFSHDSSATESSHSPTKFDALNHSLAQLGIAGKIISEYWQRQWEFVSAFNGQSPLEEANNLALLINKLPVLFRYHQIGQVLIKPVVWFGDKGKLAPECDNIFSTDTRAVHVPNAIQLNVSVWRGQENLLARQPFGENLQQVLMSRSQACSLLFLPEEEAFLRIALKSHYGLHNELCSPDEISGGHQGSVALYRKRGKHNQPMGKTTLVVDQHNHTLKSTNNWQSTTRIEHRLGASSVFYNPYINIIFALLCVLEALDLEGSDIQRTKLLQEKARLPNSLFDQQNSTGGDVKYGAISLFSQDLWFAQAIDNALLQYRKSATFCDLHHTKNGAINDDLPVAGCNADSLINEGLCLNNTTTGNKKTSIGRHIHQLIINQYRSPSLIIS